MDRCNRRQFLADVAQGMLIAGIGPALAVDLGLADARAADGPEALTFGKLEPLVCLLQETAPDKLLPILVEKQRQGTELSELVAAAALANARAFGGEDYIGFHTLMALTPALQMSKELPAERRALPVLKVLYRNSKRLQDRGGRKHEVLHAVAAAKPPEGKTAGQAILEAVRRKDVNAAEQTFAGVAARSTDDAFNELMVAVMDGQDVHRIVLPYRAWDLLDVVGKENAHTMLRQSVRFCIKSENPRYSGYFTESRALLPKLLDQYKLVSKPFGTRAAEDGWVDELAMTIFKGPAARAAEAVAAALAEGFAPTAIGEGLALATNQLVLRDDGRPTNQAENNKPAGSVHGDGIGVHACDSANAWRNIARIGNQRTAASALILGAYQAAKDRTDRGGDFLTWEPYPRADAREKVAAKEPEALLRQAEEAIRARAQALACAAVQRYGELGFPARPVFDLMLRYAISEDGALHAEKYYRTVSEEFAIIRPAFRWRQLVALARVTASEYGYPAPGYAEACKLLKV
ncbi:MAG: hypothetical protein JNM56_23185 [Planctomycetia bacterium]|nr:hypothetical protein [Planctomycetia bacterium]